MPVESAPVLNSEWELSPPARPAAPAPIEPLARIEVAPSDLVEPVMRAARRRVASLRLTARATAHRAAVAEEALAGGGNGPDAMRAERESELAALRSEIEDRRGGFDDMALAARRDAAELIESARAESRADVAAARGELDRSLATTTLAVASIADVDPRRGAPEVEPPGTTPRLEAKPPSDPLPSLPPPPAPSTPAPSYPPPAPAATTYQAVLVQAQDGSFQTAYLRTDLGLPAAPMPFAAPPFVGQGAQVAPWAPGPGAVGMVLSAHPATVAVPQAPAETVGRRLLHLDVILPLVAVFIVLIVLLAWLG